MNVLLQEQTISQVPGDSPVNWRDDERVRQTASRSRQDNTRRVPLIDDLIWKQARPVLLVLGTLLFVSMTALALDAKKLISQASHTSWSAKDGIPGPVRAIAQTPDGYLWLGTDSGLFRFDGLRFVLWEPNSNEQFPGSSVLTLCVARDGALWIGFGSGGISRLRNGRLTNFSPADGIPNGRILSIAEDKHGSIWAGGPYGLSRFENDRWQKIGAETGYPAPGAQVIFVDGKGNVWVATDGINFGLGNNLIQRNTILVLAPDERLFSSTGEAVGMVTKMAESPDGDVWISELSANSVRPIKKVGTTDFGIRIDEEPTSLLFENDNLWIGYTGGLRRTPDFRRAGDVSHDRFLEQDGLSSAGVNTMFKDREGNLWIGTSRGLDRFSENKVTSISVKEGLIGEGSVGLTSTPDGSVWFFDYTGDAVQRMRDGQFSVFKLTPYSRSDSTRILSLNAEKDGPIWLGGSFKLARQAGDKFVYVDIDGIRDGAMVEAVGRDSAGNLWAALTDTDSVQKVVRLRNGEWTNFSETANLPKFRCRTFYGDSFGRVWLAFENGEVVVYENDSFRTYSVKDGLPDGKALTIVEDSSGRIWIGGENGLSRYENDRFITLKRENGLPSNSVSGILEDGNGFFWLAGALAIIRVSSAELDKALADPFYQIQSTTFDAADGLRGSPRQNAPFPTAARATDGKLWFATNSGVVVIDPSELPRNTLPPPVIIETVRVDNQTLPSDTEQALPPNPRNLEFYYTALSLTVPERNRFRYKLEGYDQDWRDPVGLREVSYTNLPPGQYRFRVIASNNDGVWNEEGATFAFYIKPSFYQTYWFLALCIVLAGALVWTGYQWRVRQIADRLHLQFEERLAERTRIAQDLHDTLLQGFVSASMQLQVADSHLSQDSSAKPLVGRVLQVMGNVIEEGRNTLRGLRSKSTDDSLALEQQYSRIRQDLAISRKTGFSVTVEGTPQPLRQEVHGECYLIGREALANAFKHSKADNIEVNVQYTSGDVRILIRDDGCGIDSEVVRSGLDGHWGLSGMRERAEKIGARLKVWSRHNAGTEIELTVPGRIAYESEPRSSWRNLFARLFPRDTTNTSLNKGEDE